MKQLLFKKFCLHIMLLSAVTVTKVIGLSTGAPMGACSTITPGHGGRSADLPVPFLVNISSLDSGYIPGQTYTIILSATSSNVKFRGFLIQSRTSGGSTNAGMFVDNGDDQRITCDHNLLVLIKFIQWNKPETLERNRFIAFFWPETNGSGWTNAMAQAGIISSAGIADSLLRASHLTKITHARKITASNFAKIRFGHAKTGLGDETVNATVITSQYQSGITHTSNDEKSMVQLLWTAPSSGTGSILFRYAFVVRYNLIDGTNKYWSDLATGSVSEAAAMVTAPPSSVIAFNQSTYSITENAGPVQLILILSIVSKTDITIQVKTTNVSAFGKDVDYQSGPYNVTFPTGITAVSLNVPITNDNILEEDEEFTVKINNASLPENFITNTSGIATVTIRNDDVLLVEFASGQFNGSESSGFIEVTVRVTGGVSSSPITVTVAASEQSPVSAMGSGVDYNSDPFTITIDAGATEGRANISLTCDDEVEGSETFNLRLTLTSGGNGVTMGRDTSAGEIIDSTVAVSFSQSSYGVMENDGTVTLVISLSKPSSMSYQAIVNIMNLTAVREEDYARTSVTVNVPAGVVTQTLMINIINNNVVECIERFNARITSVTTCGVTIGNGNISEVIITDDDRATVSLSQSQYSVAESDTPLPVTIMLSNRASEDVVVEVTLSDGSANALVDYAMFTPLMFNITISAGLSSQSFDVDIINDMIQEDNETFNIAIRLLPSCLSLSLGTSSSTVTIIDNDVAMITFSSSTFSGSESSRVILATVIISGGVVSSSDIAVPINFTEGNATGSSVDFNSAAQNAMITAGTSSSTVNIAVANDNIVEGNETFTMNLNVPVYPGIAAGSVTMATAIIIDTSTLNVIFTQDQFAGSEAAGFVLVSLELDGGISESPFDVTVTPSQQSPLSAEGGVDFSTIPQSATFGSRMSMSNVTVLVLVDNIAERPESFDVTLSVPMNLSPAITAGSRNSAVGVITDSTRLIVEFTSARFTGSESSGFIEVIIRIRMRQSNDPIIVTVTPSEQSPVSAMGSGVDYNSDPFNITINPGATEGRANISVTCDDEVEGLETFDMRLTLTSSGNGVTLGRDTSVGEIIDSTVAVSFSQSSYGVMEDNGTVSLVIALSQPTSVPFQVSIGTMDVTTVDGEDYSGRMEMIAIPARVMTQSITISITDDNLVECVERFIVTITSVTTCGVTISNNMSEVIITDDDRATVSLGQSQYSVAESDAPLPVTIMCNTASEDVVVEVTLSDGSANAGVDYAMSTALMFNVTISAGLSSQSFDVDIIDDMIQEDNETFNIAIRLLPNCLSLSLGTSSSTVTIIDNDVAMITFSSSTFSGSESSGVIPATVIILGGIISTRDITVPITFTEITATADSDFDNSTLTAVISAGSNATIVDIPIINDTTVEENETFNISLNVLPNTGVALAAPSTAIVVIIDTAPPQILTHPMDRTIMINNETTSVSFTCMANGASSYYWLRENSSISSDALGINSSILTLHNVLPADNGLYQCVAVNEHGSSNSDFAVLTVEVLPPVVSIVPSEAIVKEGDNATFNCLATGVGAEDFKYQWSLNDQAVDSGNSPALMISSVSVDNTGNYTCSVINSYDDTGLSGVATLYFRQYCNSTTQEYTKYGFSITWNRTLIGNTVEAPCIGTGLKGVVTRSCRVGAKWDDESVECYREANDLLNRAINLTTFINELNETERIAETNRIANTLANITASTQGSILAEDINSTVNIISALNNIAESALTSLNNNDTFFEDTTSVIDNLLSQDNADSWRQLGNDSSTGQELLAGVEQLTNLLSKTLTSDVTETVKTRQNIVIKAERISDDDIDEGGYMFPDNDDDLTEYNGGAVQLMVPGDLLQDINSTELTLAITVIRNDTGLTLPSSRDRNGEFPVPVSAIFSLQIDPLPNSTILEANPIMMMFNVDVPSNVSDQEFTLDDVTCNFYNFTMNSNNLNQVGGWSTEGVTVDEMNSNRTSVTCLTTHLTSFAVLVSMEDEQQPTPHGPEDEDLSVFIYIGCALSLVFLCVSIVTLILMIFKTRNKINHLFIHLNLCFSLVLGVVTFIAGIERNDDEVSCKVVAALLQYFFISAVCWMLCEVVFLYMISVTVCGNKLNKLIFFFILGWGPAIPIVAISAGIAHEHYTTEHFCWIAPDGGTIYAFIGPVAAIILIICVFMAMICKALCVNKRKVMNDGVASKRIIAKDLLRAAIIVLPVLVATGIIGILVVNDEIQVLEWIFAVANVLLGILILIFYVLIGREGMFGVCDNPMRNNKTYGVNTPKGKASQDTSNETGSHAKKLTGVDYLSPQKSPLDKSEELGETEDSNQIKLTTFRRKEELMMERYDAEGESLGNGRHDADKEDKRSITDDAIEMEAGAMKPTPFPRIAK